MKSLQSMQCALYTTFDLNEGASLYLERKRLDSLGVLKNYFKVENTIEVVKTRLQLLCEMFAVMT